MKRANLVKFTDILAFAESQGIASWNKAIDILDGIRPEYEVTSYDYDRDMFAILEEDDEEYSFSQECRNLMLKFFDHNKVDEITVIN